MISNLLISDDPFLLTRWSGHFQIWQLLRCLGFKAREFPRQHAGLCLLKSPSLKNAVLETSVHYTRFGDPFQVHCTSLCNAEGSLPWRNWECPQNILNKLLRICIQLMLSNGGLYGYWSTSTESQALPQKCNWGATDVWHLWLNS